MDVEAKGVDGFDICALERFEMNFIPFLKRIAVSKFVFFFNERGTFLSR